MNWIMLNIKILLVNLSVFYMSECMTNLKFYIIQDSIILPSFYFIVLLWYAGMCHTSRFQR